MRVLPKQVDDRLGKHKPSLSCSSKALAREAPCSAPEGRSTLPSCHHRASRTCVCLPEHQGLLSSRLARCDLESLQTFEKTVARSSESD